MKNLSPKLEGRSSISAWQTISLETSIVKIVVQNFPPSFPPKISTLDESLGSVIDL